MRAYLRVILSVAVAAPLFALVACDETIEATKAPPAVDAGTDSGPSTSLFQRLGGKDGIKAFVDAVVAEELKDSEVGPFFAPNINPAGPPAGRPNGAQIKGCLVEQIAAASSDKDKGDPVFSYPGVKDGPAPKVDGFTCRDMKTAHMGLGITESAFAKFGAIAAGVAKASGKLSDADLTSLTNFLNLNKAAIVEAPKTDGGTDSSVPADTGTDAPIVDASDAG